MQIPGEIYYLPGPFAPWLWPALVLTGIICQIAALALRRRWLGTCGLALALAGAMPERDLTLAVGLMLVFSGMWFCAKKE